MSKKIGIIGDAPGTGAITEAIIAAHRTPVMVITSNKPHKGKTVEDLKELANNYRKKEEYKPPVFESQEVEDEFMRETAPIFQKKIPKMPFKTLGDYVTAYMDIYDKKSTLTGSQRIRVKNIVHLNLRKGTIILK